MKQMMVSIFLINGQKISCIGMESDIPADTADLSVFTDLTNSANDLQYVSFNDSVELSFGFIPKDTMLEIYDRILTNDGSDKYSSNVMDVISITLNDENSGSFIINKNKATMLSSDLEDYEPGKAIRGFSFSVECEKKNYLYAFVIQTDASY